MIDVATTTGNTLKAVIIGGGISGLSVAWYLQKLATENNIQLEYTLLENGDRWGGKVLTETVDGDDGQFVVEAGPDSFLTQKPWALQLARELGLDNALLGTNDSQRSTYVLSKGKPVVLPDGVMLIVPTKIKPFVMSPLLSLMGKLRMGLDLIIPPKTDGEDETLADFIRRRLGNEALDKIAEPLMSGIYNAEAERQSIMATFPRFRDIEKQYGSLTRGMIAARKKIPSKSTNSGKKTSAFMSLQGGTTDLIRALVPKLTGDLRLNVKVTTVKQSEQGHYTVQLQDGSTIEADVVIMTTPAYVTADLVRDISSPAADELEGIRYVSTGTISLAFKKSDMPDSVDGFGIVIPSSENRPINAITISSTKFDQRAPEGYVLMRVFFGGSRSPQSMELDDETLLQTVRQQLREIYGIQVEPLFYRIYRWWNANPQYDLGHLERVETIESELPDGLYVTGSAYRGVGMPDCVHQSQLIAEKVLQGYKERQIVS